MQIRNPLLSHDKTVHTDRAVPDAFVDVANGIAGLDAAGKVPWANVTKTGSNLTEIATRSHTALSDIGTNTHAQIDTAVSASTTHIAAAAPHSGHANTPTKTGTAITAGTVYQNTTGKMMLLFVPFNGVGNHAILSDAANPPTVAVASSENTGGNLIAAILDTHYYKITSDANNPASPYYILF